MVFQVGTVLPKCERKKCSQRNVVGSVNIKKKIYNNARLSAVPEVPGQFGTH